jgi:hypothetical protein
MGKLVTKSTNLTCFAFLITFGPFYNQNQVIEQQSQPDAIAAQSSARPSPLQKSNPIPRLFS